MRSYFAADMLGDTDAHYDFMALGVSPQAAREILDGLTSADLEFNRTLLPLVTRKILDYQTAYSDKNASLKREILLSILRDHQFANLSESAKTMAQSRVFLATSMS